MISFNEVKAKPDIDKVSELAYEVWNQHFVAIIGQEQVDYMLDKFQNSNAIARQISDGYEYYLIANNDKNVGYLGLLTDINTSKMMISKFYIKQGSRGLGIGSAALKYVQQLAKQRKLNKAWLTVNRHNKKTIDWYLKQHFVITDEVKKDIGQGFYMDDYIMELEIL